MVAEQTRWPLWLPVFFGSGIGLYFSLPIEPARSLLVAAGALAALCFAASLATRRALVRALLATVMAVSLGFGAAKLREEIVAAPILEKPIGPIPVDGCVEYAQAHGKGVRVLLSHLRSDAFAPAGTPQEIRIGFRSGAEGLRPGDRIHAMIVLMPPPGPAAPGAYDFGRTAFFLRLGAVGYAYGRPDLIAREPPTLFGSTAGEWIRRLRFKMTERVHAVLPGSTGSIAAALITGDRGGIAEQDEQALRDAGLAHVLAIAGLHMALVGLGIFWIVRAVLALFPALALHHPIKKWAALAALSGAGFYLVISGAGPPSIRAFTMLAMMLLAILVDRPAISMRAIALAATIILLVEPESLVEPGFQMSFAAVAGLIGVAEWEQAHRVASERWARPNFVGVRRYVRGIATTSFVGSIATVPFAIYHFDRATHFAVLGNLLAMPIMGFITMPAAALSVALMPLGLDVLPLRIMGLGIEIMLAVGSWVSHLPGAVSVAAAWPVSALMLISLGGLWCVIWRRSWRWLGLIAIAGGIVLAYTQRVPDLLIGRDGSTAAIRTHGGALAFIGWPRDGYTASEWLKRAGDGRDPADAVGTSRDGVRCDGLGCVARAPSGKVIAVPARPDALGDDCALADVVVGNVDASPCRKPALILGREQIERAGGYAVWLTPLRLQSVQDARGDRPWSRVRSSGTTD